MDVVVIIRITKYRRQQHQQQQSQPGRAVDRVNNKKSNGVGKLAKTNTLINIF
jgi:hypothetical protein